MMPSESISSDRLLASSLFANWWPATTLFMASARELEKFCTNSSYLPWFEWVTRPRHSGSAMARVSSSLFSMMFMHAIFCAGILLLVVSNQVITRRLLHGLFASFRIATRNSQHVPVFVVYFH